MCQWSVPCHDDGMDSETRTYVTGDREVVLDLTRDCTDFVNGRGAGLLNLFVPHATAGLAILETGAGTDDDLLTALVDLLPADDPWKDRMSTRLHSSHSCAPRMPYSA